MTEAGLHFLYTHKEVPMALALPKSADNRYDVGSFDAKTYFAELLRMVQDGAVINISKNGKPVAVMQSPAKQAGTKAMQAHERMKALSEKIAARNMAEKLPQLTVQEINELKNSGRKW